MYIYSLKWLFVAFFFCSCFGSFILKIREQTTKSENIFPLDRKTSSNTIFAEYLCKCLNWKSLKFLPIQFSVFSTGTENTQTESILLLELARFFPKRWDCVNITSMQTIFIRNHQLIEFDNETYTAHEWLILGLNMVCNSSSYNAVQHFWLWNSSSI